MTDMPIHPVLSNFPECEPWVVQDMADSIAASGLIHPIIVQDVGGVRTLIDGRARLKACEMAGVEPTFEVLPEDADAVDVIARNNLYRANYTLSQVAMGTAMLGVPTRCPAIEEARFVLRQRPSLAENVLYGSVLLLRAAEEIRADQEAAALQVEQLNSLPPLLRECVQQGEVDLDAAMALAGPEQPNEPPPKRRRR